MTLACSPTGSSIRTVVKRSRVWAAGYGRLRSNLALQYGHGRPLDGSDYPLLSPERVLRELSAVPLAKAERQAILGKNAMRLLDLKDDRDGQAR